MDVSVRTTPSLLKWMGTGIWCIMVLSSGSVIGQRATTGTGTVTDQTTDEPQPGVNIPVMGTTIGTTTDGEGMYELNVPSLSDTLRFSFIGYSSRVIPIQGRSTIDVALESATIIGEELVVVGFGSQREKELNGSVLVVMLLEMTS